MKHRNSISILKDFPKVLWLNSLALKVGVRGIDIPVHSDDRVHWTPSNERVGVF